jgi:hypothetical protein
LWDACGSNDLMVAVAEPLLAQQLQYWHMPLQPTCISLPTRVWCLWLTNWPMTSTWMIGSPSQGTKWLTNTLLGLHHKSCPIPRKVFHFMFFASCNSRAHCGHWFFVTI